MIHSPIKNDDEIPLEGADDNNAVRSDANADVTDAVGGGRTRTRTRSSSSISWSANNNNTNIDIDKYSSIVQTTSENNNNESPPSSNPGIDSDLGIDTGSGSGPKPGLIIYPPPPSGLQRYDNRYIPPPTTGESYRDHKNNNTHTDNHDEHSDDDINLTQSASTWPSISQYKKSMHMAIPYSTYNHIFTLFAVLLLMTTLAFFSALDAAVHCTTGTQVKLWFQRSDFEWDLNGSYFNNVDFSEYRSKYSNIFGEGGSGSSSSASGANGNGNGNITYYSNDGYAYGYSDDGARRHGRSRNLQMQSLFRGLEDAAENNNNNNNNNADGGYYGNDDANANADQDQDDANAAANDDVNNNYNDDQGNVEGNNQNDDTNANAADDNGANAYGYEYAYGNQNEYYGNQNGNQQQYGNGYYAYYDQNSNRYAKAESCRELFCSSILISCPIVALLCALACRWTLKDDSQWKKDLRSSALKASLSPTSIMTPTSMSTPTFGSSTAYTYTSAHAVPKSISLAKGYNNRYTMQDDDRDTQRVEDFKSLVANQCRHLRSCKMLLLLSIACMALWTRVQVLIEAQSDYPTTIYNDDDDGRQQEEEDLFNLQFQSLGAINNVGEVGQNANLYYSGWISLLISIALVYELSRITLKHRRTTKNLQLELAKISKHARSCTQTNAVETIMTKTKSQQQLMKDKRLSWHEVLYKLRFRTRVWLSTFIASTLLYTSSNRVWRNLIYPTAIANGDVEMNGYYNGKVCTIVHGYISLKSRDDLGLMHPSECERTKAARATGVLCICLTLMALFAHFVVHRMVAKEMKSYTNATRNSSGVEESISQIKEKKRKLIPLRAECLLACVLSLVFAINALFATAVDGPAANVGDLYYSSWFGFVMSVRLTLSCLEDILEDADEINNFEAEENRRPKMMRWLSLHGNFNTRDEVSTRVVMLSPTHDTEKNYNEETMGSYIGGMPIPKENSLHEMFEEKVIAEEDASRAKRMRRWASGCIFSSMYLIAALDAAFHKSYGSLDIVQMYMVLCPCVVSSLSLLMFIMCLESSTYQIVDKFKVGGIISLFLTGLWMGNLILTLHHESSWAVNEIGDVQMANLYYFTWGTALNAGLLMSSYVKKVFPSKSKNLMVVLWLAVVKICFVMFGSCIDILLSVKDQCEASVHGDATATFCERTQSGAILGFIGMAAGFLAALYRFFVPKPSVHGQTTEAAMSFILTGVFAVSLFLITGIGGPGQSVGDLYYGSWMAFLASLVASSSIYSDIKSNTSRTGELEFVCAGSSDDETPTGAATPYSYMESPTACFTKRNGRQLDLV